eukprot:2074026-Pyramimonas_sp.AAC.1
MRRPSAWRSSRQSRPVSRAPSGLALLARRWSRRSNGCWSNRDGLHLPTPLQDPLAALRHHLDVGMEGNSPADLPRDALPGAARGGPPLKPEPAMPVRASVTQVSAAKSDLSVVTL